MAKELNHIVYENYNIDELITYYQLKILCSKNKELIEYYQNEIEKLKEMKKGKIK